MKTSQLITLIILFAVIFLMLYFVNWTNGQVIREDINKESPLFAISSFLPVFIGILIVAAVALLVLMSVD